MNAATRPSGPRQFVDTSGAKLSGRDIVCFSHDWTGDPLSKTHLMRLLARENRVLWVNSIGYRSPTVSRADAGRAVRKLMAAATPVREVEPNLFVTNPLAVPVYGRPFFQRLNRRLLIFQIRRVLKRMGFRDVINWVFNPAAATVAGHLGESTIIYHCVDEYTEFSGVDKEGLARLERDLLRRSDVVIVSADRLLQTKAPYNPKTYLVRHGVDFDHFRRACDRVDSGAVGSRRPVLGFFGLVADWVDVELLAETARRFPEAELVVVGKVTTDVSALEALPNVRFLGRRPYEELPELCGEWDVALMPFRLNELTLNANPLKVREYLAAGLPVVSTPIPEVEALGLCRIAATPDAFEREIRDALRDPGPKRERSDAIRGESWQARLEEIERYLFAATADVAGSKYPSRQSAR